MDVNKSLKANFEDIWALLKRAMADKKHPFRFLVLATSNTRAPGMRYVVLRKIDEAGHLILFTDQRSSKVTEIRINPEVTLLFYHPQARLQVRVEGRASLHHKDAVCREYWPMVQGETWKAYGSIKVPGEVIDRPDEAYEWDEDLAKELFTIIRIDPKRMEVLQLNGLTHLRAGFEKQEGEWSGDWLVP